MIRCIAVGWGMRRGGGGGLPQGGRGTQEGSGAQKGIGGGRNERRDVNVGVWGIRVNGGGKGVVCKEMPGAEGWDNT